MSSSSLKRLKKAYPALRASVPLEHRPLPEAATLPGLQEAVCKIAESRLFGVVVRAGGVMIDGGNRAESHRELTIEAANALSAHGQEYVITRSSRAVAPPRAAPGPGILHFDGWRERQKRINIHRTLQGRGDVMIGMGQEPLGHILHMPREVITPSAVFDALKEAVQRGETLPDLMHPQVYAADLQAGDTVIFPEHPLDTPEGVVWHSFGTTESPRSAAAVWLAPIVTETVLHNQSDFDDAALWENLGTPVNI